MPLHTGARRGISRRTLLKRASGLAVVAIGARWGLQPATASALADEPLPAGYIEKQIVRGNIPPASRLQIEALLAQAGFEYASRLLPDASAAYDGQLYQVVPETIWWHWDGGPTPSAEDKDRVLATYYGLAGRTKRGDPVSAHFCVGPGKILQMLPISQTHIIQGRLTDDSEVEEVLDALSYGGLQIETTGNRYIKTPPPESQTEGLLTLTCLLMKQYGIPFQQIVGHMERSPRIRKPDPGIKYLTRTRVRLLQRLLAVEEFNLIGPPQSWRFYQLVEKKKRLVRITTQTPDDILGALTAAERETIEKRFETERRPPQDPHGQAST